MEANSEINKITIVGSGTSGAMAAAYLRKHLPPHIELNVIAQTNENRIGVGEASVPSIKFFMRSIGLKESEWLPKVNGTYKCGIKFTNWMQPECSYLHPFHREKDFKVNRLDFEYGHNFLDILNFNLNGKSHEEFLNNTTLAHLICDNYLSPVSPTNNSYLSYAYHFDGQLLADLLLAQAQKMGVKLIYDEVETSILCEKGYITSLKLKSGKEIFSDFYIDSTGFKGKLINDFLEVPFLNYSHKLFTDSAIAVNVENDFQGKLPPYTESIATDSGWIWKIPLRTRWGSGIVYNSNFETKESAYEKLGLEYPSNRNQFTSVKEIKMTPGRRSESWKKNCVAIGLAGSFIEPLESTSIGLTEYQLFLIRKLLPKSKLDTHQSTNFNLNFNSAFDSAVDFIGLHYILTNRDDTPFWQYVQNKKSNEHFHNLIAESLEIVRSGSRLSSYQMFGRFSYACVLTGLELPILIDQSQSSNPELIEIALNKRKQLKELGDQLKKVSYLHSEQCRLQMSV